MGNTGFLISTHANAGNSCCQANRLHPGTSDFAVRDYHNPAPATAGRARRVPAERVIEGQPADLWQLVIFFLQSRHVAQ
jgi:hypothetical protein